MPVNIDTPDKFQRVFSVSRETMARLVIYNRLLLKWNQKINLVSRQTIAQTWHRHFSDSAQLLKYAPKAPKKWVDIGSGAGFPGMVAAIMLAESSPDTRVYLVDSDARKMAFLAAVARETGIKLELQCTRIDEVPNLEAEVISARALAPLDRLLPMSANLCGQNATLLFLKGRGYESELTSAKAICHTEPEIFTSVTDENAVVLRFKGCKIVS